MQNLGLFNSKINVATALSFNNLTPKLTSHLVSVYTLLAYTVASAALGSYLHLTFHIGSTIFLFAAIALIFAIALTPNTPNNKTNRTLLLLAFGLCEGLFLGPLVEVVLETDPSVIFVALLSTIAVFACFSLSALYSERRSMLYLGGFLSSAVSFMLFAGFLNVFWQSEMVFDLQLYGGLIVFVLFVMFDTQMIIEKADAGDNDTVMHALNLFTDFVAIFVRLLIILSKMKGKDKKRR